MTAPQLVLASPATLAELVSRLPAEARAQVAWTPKRIADMAAALLEVPLLTDGAIEAAGDAYLEAARALSPALLKLAPVAVDLSALVQTGLENDLRLLSTLDPANAKAAIRAAATILVVAHLGLKALGRIEVAELEKALAEFDASPQDQHVSLLRATALVTAVFEGLKRGSPVPGRVEALARRADSAAAEFAALLARDDDALRLPWYVESAPGSASVEAFAAWNPANRATLRPVGQPTRQDLEAWERVKADIDGARPHRKLFT